MSAALDDDFDLPPGVATANDDHSAVRCYPDGGDTIATDGELRGERHICLQWARACCPNGARCALRHALPTLADENRLVHSADGITQDIFGRPRGARHERALADPLQCQTVRVDGLPAEGDGSQQQRRRALDALGSEWGEVVRTWLVADPRVGYLRFKWRSSAQVFVEAMHGKCARPDVPDAPLELAWCFHDPAEIQASQAREMAFAAAAESRARQEATSELYKRLERERDAGSAPSGGAVRKRPRVERGADSLEHDGSAAAWVEQDEQAITAVTARYPGAEPDDDGEVRTGEGTQEPQHAVASSADSEGAPLPAGWLEGVDPATGCTYYYDTSTRAEPRGDGARPAVDALPKRRWAGHNLVSNHGAS